MKPIQLILIAVALVAALGAGFMMMNLNQAPAPVVAQQVEQAPQIALKQVLVAGEDIPMGSALGIERLSWQDWPESGIRESFIVKDATPEALEEYAPTIARTSFFAGEPIREQKIVRSDSGYLSAILPAGKRAIAIRVQAETSAGGFILPNDRVDVILSYKKDDEWITKTVLENVRVLAIDQVIEEQDGQKAQVGNTATLELDADQSAVVTEAVQLSGNKLALALRSIEDADEIASNRKNRRGNVRLIRDGKATNIQTSN